MRLQPLCFPSTLRTLREVACFLGDNSVLVFLCDGKDDRQLPLAPSEELGAAGFLPPGVLTQIQTKSVLFPSVQVWGSTSNQHLFFFFFFKKDTSKEPKLWPFLSIVGKHLGNCKTNTLSINSFKWPLLAVISEGHREQCVQVGQGPSREHPVLQLSYLHGHRWIPIPLHLARLLYKGQAWMK